MNMTNILSKIGTAYLVILLATACISVEIRGNDRAKAPTPSAPAASSSGEWIQTTSADFQSGSLVGVKVIDLEDGAIEATSPQQGTYTSAVKKADFTFNAVGARATATVPEGTGLEVEIRVSGNGKDWSRWVPVHAETPDKESKDDATSQIVSLGSSKYLQYRLIFSPQGPRSPTIEDMTITYVNSAPGPDLKQAKNATLPKAAGQPSIISREGWGANERYRFDQKGQELWPAEFKKPEKIIVHHTLTQNDDPNPVAMVRAVYYYHAVTLAWGDIGYNYLIDAQGNIYEGRRGDGVVAGHSYGHNQGSIGIAVLGNYLEGQVSDAARGSLVDLITWLSEKYGIDPLGKSYFVDRELPNVSGHKDANPTSCPGTNLYAIIPELRKATYARLPAPNLVLESPAEGKLVSQVVPLKAVAGSDKWPVTRVDFLLDGQTLGSLTKPEWVWQWDSSKTGDGSHEVKVVAHNALGKTATIARKVVVWRPAISWYFAEGSTVPPFQTWLQFLNPTTRPAKVVATFWNEASKEQVRELSVPPKSRTNLLLNDLVPGQSFSTRVEADQFVYAERATFFGYEGHSSTGARKPSKQWYFAEGATGSGYSTWLLLMNPNGTATKATITFYKMGQGTSTKEVSIEPTSRLNVQVDREVPSASVGFKIESDLPIVADRSVYFDGGKGGHSSIGAIAPSPTWYFAEGAGDTGFRTWILLLNPNPDPADVKITFMNERGDNKVWQTTVPPNTRANVTASDVTGPGGFGAKLEASRPIVAERSMYFTDMHAGHSSMGIPNLSNQWYLPEGATTSGRFDWILVLNPNPEPANITVTYVTDKGDAKSESLKMGPASRANILVNKAMPNATVSAIVQSDRPVAVERSTYFNDNRGMTNSTGLIP
ncbi:MAG: N-acetylmuramoyl-L-alanine amidase [Chloroflexi bacterium]|nr:N-acetylmuramoyl-L-alanine amidase [Chloroflexota bacterium]